MIKEYLERQFKNYHTITSGCITPEMFGAKGDGVTDDSTALTRAINAAKTLRLPLFLSKSYYSSTLINIPAQLLVEGTAIAPTSQVGIKPKTWNIKSPNGVKILSHTTLRNVGFLETTIEITGSRNQLEDCVFSNCDRAIYFHNTTSYNYEDNQGKMHYGWVGEEYIRGCYFYDCLVGLYNETYIDGDGKDYPIIIDSEVSGCTAINDRKYSGLQNDTFMAGKFTALRVIDNHLYMSAVCKDCTLSNMLFATNYFDNPFTFMTANINGQVVIQGNTFFTDSTPSAEWDENPADHYVTVFTRYVSGMAKWVIFDGNTFMLPVNRTKADLMREHYYFVRTTTPLALVFTNNNFEIKGISSEYNAELRYAIVDKIRYGLTYNGKTLAVHHTTAGLSISGFVDMPSNYGSTNNTYGSHTIPAADGYTTRLFATLEYNDDPNNTDANSRPKHTNVLVKLTNSGGVDIEKAPSDYVNRGRIWFNACLGDYCYDTNNIVTGGN